MNWLKALPFKCYLISVEITVMALHFIAVAWTPVID